MADLRTIEPDGFGGIDPHGEHETGGRGRPGWVLKAGEDGLGARRYAGAAEGRLGHGMFPRKEVEVDVIAFGRFDGLGLERQARAHVHVVDFGAITKAGQAGESDEQGAYVDHSSGGVFSIVRNLERWKMFSIS